ncbi:MAG TPA: hypothetical protein VHF46_06450 [Rubrobacteraceae bacterium]|nr:hypothetical protein [Rubrobacteraceae bacterium]
MQSILLQLVKEFRWYLGRRGIKVMIPHEKNEHHDEPLDREIHRTHNRI